MNKEEATKQLRDTWNRLCRQWEDCEALGLTIDLRDKRDGFGIFGLSYPPQLKLEISETTTKKY